MGTKKRFVQTLVTLLPVHVPNFLESKVFTTLCFYFCGTVIVSTGFVCAQAYTPNGSSFQCPIDPLTERYPDQTDPTCKNYFLCHRGHAFPRTCNVRTAFHPTMRQCYPRSQVPEQLCAQPIECDYNGFKQDSQDCTKYYICFYRQAIHFSCESNYIFDNIKQICVNHKEKAKLCTESKSHPGPDPKTLAFHLQSFEKPLVNTAY